MKTVELKYKEEVQKIYAEQEKDVIKVIQKLEAAEANSKETAQAIKQLKALHAE